MKNAFDVFSTKFAHDIYLQKYSKAGVETWSDTAKRVTEAVCSQLLDAKTKEKIYNIIVNRLPYTCEYICQFDSVVGYVLHC